MFANNKTFTIFAGMRKKILIELLMLAGVVMPAPGKGVVIPNDETLDRTTNGKGKLADMMAKEVSQLDAGSWFGDETMLREFIALAPEMKIKVNAGDIDRLKYW